MKLIQLFVLFGVIFGSSCKINVMKGEGKKITVNPTVSSFNAVDIEVPFKVDLQVKQGAIPSVQIEGYENIMKHIVTKVENNTLIVSCDLGEIWSVDYDEFTSEITVPALRSVTLSGAPEAVIHGTVSGDHFKLDISGAGKVTADSINVGDFNTTVSGAAEITVNGGTVGSASYVISGAGKIFAFPLQASNVSINISGAGKGEVTALSTLVANTSGAGFIRYKGNPQITKDVSGAGTIKDAN